MSADACFVALTTSMGLYSGACIHCAGAFSGPTTRMTGLRLT